MGLLLRQLRNTLLGLFVLAAAVLLVFGPRRSTRPPAGRVVVTYWEKWTGTEGAQMQQIVDEFNNTVGREKGIYVQYLSVSNVDRKTLVATAAGVPPDVAGLWDAQIAQFAAMDALEPLDEMARACGITSDYYKPVYWKACTYEGRLWGLISTPWAVALHYNKRIFQEKAEAIRKAGGDPSRPPRTIEELDRYAEALDERDEMGRLKVAGYLPLEPGWFMVHTPFWFGASIYDEHSQRFTLTDQRVIQAFQWLRSYSERLGPKSMTDFRAGAGGFSGTLNPFLAGTLVMEQQGPWMANYIEEQRPSMNRWKMFKDLKRNEKLAAERKLSVEERRANYEWGAAPFPPSDPAYAGATFAGFDVLVIPAGSKHKKEAFEFIAYVNRQEVMEKICSLHCKNSCLTKVSDEFRNHHPNPYIEVFENLVSSPNARAIPPCPIWPEVVDEMNSTIQNIYLLNATTEEALREAQERLQQKLEKFKERQAQRRRALADARR